MESVYQDGKDYGRGLSARITTLTNGFQAKKANKARAFVQGAENLKGFHVSKEYFDKSTGTAAYDYLWARSAVAALGGPEAASKSLAAYDGFSDMFDRPGRSMACQAQAAAVLKTALSEAAREKPLAADRNALPEVLTDPDKWMSFHARVTRDRAAERETATAPAPPAIGDVPLSGRPARWKAPAPAHPLPAPVRP